MPELPEVEVLVRHLRPLVIERRICGVEVRRAKSVRPDTAAAFRARLIGGRIRALERRAKFLVFTLESRPLRAAFPLVGHLGMTGRMFLQPRRTALPKHAAVVLDLGGECLVFEDPRYFGRLSLDAAPLEQLGPEPLADGFAPADLRAVLGCSRQPIKVRLLDQQALAGVGNIYASEALFVAGIPPTLPCVRLGPKRVARLWRALRTVLQEAIDFGSTVPLNWSGQNGSDGLFYYGRDPAAPDYYEERLRLYGRQGKPCRVCGTAIRRRVLAARSTFSCPRCQPR